MILSKIKDRRKPRIHLNKPNLPNIDMVCRKYIELTWGSITLIFWDLKIWNYDGYVMYDRWWLMIRVQTRGGVTEFCSIEKYDG